MRMILNVTSSTEVPHVVNLRSPSWCPRTLPSGCPHNIILAHQTLHAYKQPIRHRYSMERTNYLRGAQLKNGKPTSTYCLPLRYSSVHTANRKHPSTTSSLRRGGPGCCPGIPAGRLRWGGITLMAICCRPCPGFPAGRLRWGGTTLIAIGFLNKGT